MDPREAEMLSDESTDAMRWRRALATIEAKIFLAGLLLLLFYLGAVALTLQWSAELCHRLLTMTGMHVFLGRAAGLTTGYGSGLSTWVVIVANIVIETFVVMLFFPIFVLSYRKLIVVGPLTDAMERAHQVARSQEGRIMKYGMPMLLLFVWLPLPLTGPVVGAVIGFLIGLRPLANLAIVLAGTYLAILCWGVALQRIHNALTALGPYPPLIFVAAVLLIAVSLLVRRAVASHNADADRERGK